LRESDVRTLAALRKWSVLLDSAFRVPGTNLSFGLDPILGLIPGLGDLTTPLFSALLLLHAVRLRIPKIVQLRMLLNAALDLVIGVVPLAGDFFDFGLKANVRNLALLERHARPDATATRSDWAFVLIVLAVLALVAITPFLIISWLLSHVRLY
jgi:hypothetical protein